jgi:hypothetical protein
VIFAESDKFSSIWIFSAWHALGLSPIVVPVPALGPGEIAHRNVDMIYSNDFGHGGGHGCGLSGPAFGTIMPKHTTSLPGGDSVTHFIQPGAMA